MTARYRWSGGGGGRSVGTVVQPPGSRTHRSPLGGHGRNTWQEGGGLAALTPRGGDHTRRAALRLRCVGRARQEHLAGRRGVRRLTRRGEDHTGRAVRGIGARIIRFQAGATAAGSAAEQAPALAHGRLMGWREGGGGDLDGPLSLDDGLRLQLQRVRVAPAPRAPLPRKDRPPPSNAHDTRALPHCRLRTGLRRTGPIRSCSVLDESRRITFI